MSNQPFFDVLVFSCFSIQNKLKESYKVKNLTLFYWCSKPTRYVFDTSFQTKSKYQNGMVTQPTVELDKFLDTGLRFYIRFCIFLKMFALNEMNFLKQWEITKYLSFLLTFLQLPFFPLYIIVPIKGIVFSCLAWHK